MAVVNRSLSRNYAPAPKQDPQKYYMYPFVAGGVMLMIGLILFSTFTQIRIIPNYLQDSTFIVPALFFIPVGIMAYKGSIPKKHSHIVTTILLVLAIVALPMTAMTIVMETYSTPVESPAYYSKTMQLMGAPDNATIAIFPTELPVEAENTKFFYGSDAEARSMRLELNFRIGQHMADPLENGMKSHAVWSGTLSELAASEYAAVAEQIPTTQPEDAVYYVIQTSTLENSETLDSVVLASAADDGTLYYLYKVWTPQ